LREAVDEREQAGRGGQRAGDVEPRAVAALRPDVVQQRSAPIAAGTANSRFTYRHQRQDSVLGEHAAEQQADRAAAAGDRAEDAERLAALGRVGERRGQQRQRRGREQRAERALQRRGRRRARRSSGGAAERRGDGEAEQAADERPLAAEEVAERPPSSSRLPNASA
jgi:hypothetical protein